MRPVQAASCWIDGRDESPLRMPVLETKKTPKRTRLMRFFVVAFWWSQGLPIYLRKPYQLVS
jgi:hypothetical protein